MFSVEQITSVEPYLTGTSDKDDQESAYLVVVIYRTLLAVAQLTFQPEFLSRTMTTIATSMSTVSLKVAPLCIRMLIVAFERKRASCLSHLRDVERLLQYHQSCSDLFQSG